MKKNFWKGNFSFSIKEREEEGRLYIPKPVLEIFTVKELIAFFNGLKPAACMTLSPPELNKRKKIAQKWAEKNGYSLAVSKARHAGPEKRGARKPFIENSYVAIILADSRKTAEEAASVFLKNNKRFGELMGYPECCIEFHEENSKTARENLYIKSFLASKKFSRLLNIFNFANLISHVPCHLNCPKSKKYAKKLHSIIHKENPFFGKTFEFFFNTPSLFWDYYGNYLFKGEKKNEHFLYEEVFPSIQKKAFPDALKNENYEKLIEFSSVLEKGNCLKMSGEKIEVFNGARRVGELEKKRKNECILAIPGK